MDFRDYVRVVRKGWALLLVCVLAGVAVAAGYCLLSTPKYQATTGLYVSVQGADASGSGTSNLLQGTTFAQQAVTSYVSVASSAVVLQRVIDQLGLHTTPVKLAAQVKADSPLNTVLLNVTVTDTSPDRAARIANAIGAAMSYVVTDRLEKPQGGGPSLVSVQTVQPAVAPTTPSSPKVPLALALGLLAGLAVGVAAAVLRDVLDTRIRSARDIAQVTDAPLLGGISLDPDAAERPLVVHADPRSARAEAFRTLRTNLQFTAIGDAPRSWVISSAIPGEGKSTTAANLAITLAETGARVALVDGDLRDPKIAAYLGLEGGTGLTDVLIGRAELKDVMQKWGRGHLYALPAGRIPPNPSELLGSKAMAGLLSTLTGQFDYVILDAPPLLLVTDAAVLSKLTGGAILVAASGKTKRNELAAAARALEHIGSRLAGIVVTMLPTKGPDSYGYGLYGYGAHHDHAEPEPPEPAPGPRRRTATTSSATDRRAAWPSR